MEIEEDILRNSHKLRGSDFYPNEVGDNVFSKFIFNLIQ